MIGMWEIEGRLSPTENLQLDGEGSPFGACAFIACYGVQVPGMISFEKSTI